LSDAEVGLVEKLYEESFTDVALENGRDDS